MLPSRDVRLPEVQAGQVSEARAVNLIRHDGIVRVLDFTQTATGPPAIVMELVEGRTLPELLRGGLKPDNISRRDGSRKRREVDQSKGAAEGESDLGVKYAKKIEDKLRSQAEIVGKKALAGSAAAYMSGYPCVQTPTRRCIRAEMRRRAALSRSPGAE